MLGRGKAESGDTSLLSREQHVMAHSNISIIGKVVSQANSQASPQMNEKLWRVDSTMLENHTVQYSHNLNEKSQDKKINKSPLRGQRPSSDTPEKSPCPHHYVSPLESCPSYTLGPRSTRTPSHHKDPGAPGRHHTTRTQKHPDAITPQGPRSTRTPSHHKDPGAPGRHHTTRTQKHPDAITPQGPRSTRTPSHHKDPGAPGRHHTTRTQEHPDTFTTQATRWDPGTPDAIGLGGPRCNQTILDQENPEVPQTSLDQEIPEAPIIL
ncbi:hypothetical protein STEG23_010916 [Scotinomys teguina]